GLALALIFEKSPPTIRKLRLYSATPCLRQGKPSLPSPPAVSVFGLLLRIRFLRLESASLNNRTFITLSTFFKRLKKAQHQKTFCLQQKDFCPHGFVLLDE
ncbi:MAG: hypothetical protein KAI43_14100, partial [Candidatus Aureabacteria bacterium]|nr:hypothetical protein [Candidatus Auribacterota bacterium]